MKPSSRPPRALSELSDSVHQRLNMYALAANAAGVGMLALGQPCEAKIVYTHAHHLIRRGTTFHLDLNHEGKADFTLGYPFRSVESGGFRSIYALAPPGNGVEGTLGAGGFVAGALKPGTPIPNRHSFFLTSTTVPMVAMCSGVLCGVTSRYWGNWRNVTNRYLGLEFKINGKTHYGWARLTVLEFTATLTGYAYETIPNKSIKAGQTKEAAEWDEEDFGPDASLTNPIPDKPQPASLGILALGAPGVPLWRRKENESVLQRN
jgi:hypothetical protein